MNSIIAYLTSCAFHLPMAAPVCTPFWITVMLLAFASGVVILFVVAYSAVSYQRKLRAALAAEAHRRAVNEEEIQRRRWPGEELENPLRLNESGAVEFESQSRS